MAKKSEFDRKLESMKVTVSGMNGVCKPLADDLLEIYVKMYKHYIELEDIIDKEGLRIEVEKGGANNRHIVLEKNPAFDMMRNCASQMSDLANKIKRFVSDDNGPETEDEFNEF